MRKEPAAAGDTATGQRLPVGPGIPGLYVALPFYTVKLYSSAADCVSKPTRHSRTVTTN
jgi:hypothetical protein